MFQNNESIFKSVLELYNRTENSFQEDIIIVKNWIKTQPHLPEIMDNDKIKNFLLTNKCSIEKTKEKIDNYYTLRSLIPEFYHSVNSEEVRLSMEIFYWVLLPKRTKDMCRVHFLAMRNNELIDELEPTAFASQGNHLQEIRLKEDVMFKDIIIYDFRGLNWGYMLKLTPSLVMKFLTLSEKVYSNRMQAFYFINSFSIVHHFMKVVKPFLKQKLFDRIHLCKDTSILHQIFPKEMIPKDYGGEEKSLEELKTIQQEMITKCKPWFEDLENMKVNEERRPEKLRNDELLGFYGNFKKLNVD